MAHVAPRIDELLTAEQVRIRLNLPREKSVRELVARKVLPAYKLGHRCIRFHWPEIETALARHRQAEIS